MKAYVAFIRLMRSLLVIILFVPCLTMAQSTFSPLGARSLAMGSVSSIVADETSLYNNIGALAFAMHGAILASRESAALPGANRGAAGAVFRKHDIGLGMGVHRFGDVTYNEQTILAGISHRIHRTSLGIRINLIQYNAINFPVRTAWSIDFGFLTKLTSQLSIGASICNSNRAHITAQELLPVRFSAGIGFHPASSYTIALETAKELGYPVCVRLGFEYAHRSTAFLRTGIQLNPASISLGSGFKRNRLQLDAGIRYGSMIGYTAVTTVCWRLDMHKS